MKITLSRLALIFCALQFVGLYARSASAPRSFEELGAFLAGEGFAPKHLTYFDDGTFERPAFDSRIAIFAIDTSPSMRDPDVGLIDKRVRNQLIAFVENMPALQNMALLDGSGKIIYQSDSRRKGQGSLLSEEEISKAMTALARWPKYGSFDWDRLMNSVTKLQRRTFKAEAVDLFIIGEDYHYPRNPKGQLEDIVLAQRLREQQDLKINVIRAKDTFNLSNPSNAGFTAATAFDHYGQYLAYSTGGSFFYYDPPEYRQSIEATVLAKVCEVFPGQRWTMPNADLDVEVLNQALISGKAVDFDLLVDSSRESSQRIRAQLPKVSFQVEKIGADRARCQIKCQSADGSEVLIFTAGLCLRRDRWLVYHWDERSDPVSPARILFEAQSGKK